MTSLSLFPCALPCDRQPSSSRAPSLTLQVPSTSMMNDLFPSTSTPHPTPMTPAPLPAPPPLPHPHPPLPPSASPSSSSRSPLPSPLPLFPLFLPLCAFHPPLLQLLPAGSQAERVLVPLTSRLLLLQTHSTQTTAVRSIRTPTAPILRLHCTQRPPVHPQTHSPSTTIYPVHHRSPLSSYPSPCGSLLSRRSHVVRWSGWGWRVSCCGCEAAPRGEVRRLRLLSAFLLCLAAPPDEAFPCRSIRCRSAALKEGRARDVSERRRRRVEEEQTKARRRRRSRMGRR